jgi:hypothetical protein
MQAPFVSLFIYLAEAETPQLKKDYALVVEEIFKQRIKGIQNKVGAWIAPTFPKILYTIEEDNIHEDDELFYLTRLAAECTARRMVPDYISEKKMKELKEGNVFGCMGAVSKDSVVKYKIQEEFYMESIESMYNRIMNRYELKEEDQFNQEGNPNKDLNLKDLDVEIFDNGCNKYVKCEMMNKNLSCNFKTYTIAAFNKNKLVRLTMTNDHPLMVIRQDPTRKEYNIEYCEEIQCENIKVGDHIYVTEDGDSEPVIYTICSKNEVSLIDEKEKYVYDVTTETGHFMVNNIYSHNCRSFLSVWRDPENENKPKFWGRLTKLEVKPTLNCVNA